MKIRPRRSARDPADLGKGRAAKQVAATFRVRDAGSATNPDRAVYTYFVNTNGLRYTDVKVTLTGEDGTQDHKELPALHTQGGSKGHQFTFTLPGDHKTAPRPSFRAEYTDVDGVQWMTDDDGSLQCVSD